jgi:hypothetical protein
VSPAFAADLRAVKSECPPQEIAEVQPQVAGFAAVMFGDVRAKAGARRVNCMRAAADRQSAQVDAADSARLGIDHQQLRQFATCRPGITWRPQCSCAADNRGGREQKIHI